MRRQEDRALQERIGHDFADASLLQQALTHRSFGAPHNERLEFLGDSVLSLALSNLLYERFPQLSEGELSRVRSNLVNQQALAELAIGLKLGQVLRLGEGEVKSGGRERPSILADALEALFGAVYLDGGLAPALAWIARLYQPVLVSLNPQTLGKDPKTLLQEWLQGQRLPLPVYRVLQAQGASHAQSFAVECEIAALGITVPGSGNSRRLAEQEAAKAALQQAQQRQANKKAS